MAGKKKTLSAADKEAYKAEQKELATALEARVGGLVDQLIAATDETARSAAFQAYLSTQARFWKYSAGNTLLIMVQRPDATRVAGFTTWLKLGRAVRKGSKGIRIMAPMTVRVGDEESGDEVRTITRFKLVSVFAYEDTDGEPLPALGWQNVEGDYSAAWARLVALCTARGITVAHEEMRAGRMGYSAGGRIAINPAETLGNQCATLVHEIGHEVLHSAKERATYNQTEQRERMEAEAEATAYVVCTELGLPTPNSATYLALYNGTKELLLSSLGVIQKGARLILEAATTAGDATAPADDAEVAA